jgi:hypothetical protein
MAQVVEHLPRKAQDPKFKSQYVKKILKIVKWPQV